MDVRAENEFEIQKEEIIMKKVKLRKEAIKNKKYFYQKDYVFAQNKLYQIL